MHRFRTCISEPDAFDASRDMVRLFPPPMETTTSNQDINLDTIPADGNHPDTALKIQDSHPRPWPKIESLLTMDKLHEVMEEDAFVSEKLDGCNLSLSSSGLVCSRRQVLLNNPSHAELAKTKFSGLTLEKLWQSLVQTRDLCKHFGQLLKVAPENLTVTVYGEMVQHGTASCKEDKFGYRKRNYIPGSFYAFGIGLAVNKNEALDSQHLATKGFGRAACL